MRRTTMLLALVGALLLPLAGVAVAATINGDSGNDSLVGTNRSDEMRGLGGNDIIRGKRGSDLVLGGTGKDTLSGSYGVDRMRGGDNNDTISGGFYGDRIFGGAGRDSIDADKGPDHVEVADGRFDSVSCGPGEDTAVVDRVDLAEQSPEDFTRLSSCENVAVR
jgi:Ca2+-binding RTX toxin-like protein